MPFVSFLGSAVPTKLEIGPGLTLTGTGTIADPFILGVTGVLPFVGGMPTMDRNIVDVSNGDVNAFAGVVTLAGIVSPATWTCNKINFYTDFTKTPTHLWFLIYSIDASGNGTLIAQTADTPSAATSGAHIGLPLLTPVNLIAGQAYGAGLLAVGGQCAYLTGGGPILTPSDLGDMTLQPWMGATIDHGYTSPPASFTYFGRGSALVAPPYMELTV